MKACIVSMEYSIKNKDEAPKVKQLHDSYSDAQKVNYLLTDTLRWDKDDVKIFKDTS